MISFIPRVGKVQTGQSSGGFTAIIPFLFFFFLKLIHPFKCSSLYLQVMIDQFLKDMFSY